MCILTLDNNKMLYTVCCSFQVSQFCCFVFVLLISIETISLISITGMSRALDMFVLVSNVCVKCWPLEILFTWHIYRFLVDWPPGNVWNGIRKLLGKLVRVYCLALLILRNLITREYGCRCKKMYYRLYC